METEKKISFEEVFLQCNIKEEPEVETKPIYNTTTDYLLNKPLKPLPDALQKILPSFFSKKNQSDSKPAKTKVDCETFTCFGNLSLRNCKFCNFSTILKVDLDKHVEIVHRVANKQPLMRIHRFKEPRRYKCLDCQFSTSSKLVLLRHVSRSKRNHFLEEIETKFFNCHVCDYNTTSNVELRRHLWDVHSMLCRDWKIFKCEHCDFFHEKNRKLKRHLIAKHLYKEERFFHIEVCFAKCRELINLQVQQDNELNQFLSFTCDCYSEFRKRDTKQTSEEENQFRTYSYFKV